MPKTVYTVLLHVDDSKLPTILGAIAGAATLVSVTVTQGPVKEEQPKKSQHYVNGKRLKGISGGDLVLKVLADKGGCCNSVDLTNAFLAHGFAKGSWSPASSKLAAEHKIRMLGGSKFALPGTTIKMGAS
jgi:hypothetical protein